MENRITVSEVCIWTIAIGMSVIVVALLAESVYKTELEHAKTYHVIVNSNGGEIVREYDARQLEVISHGWRFIDEKTGKSVSVSGNVVIEQK